MQCAVLHVQVQQEAEKAKRMAERKDYYAILGVDHSAQPREVKSAYRRRAQVYHPDKVADLALSKEEAEQRFTDIAEAYEVQAHLPVLRSADAPAAQAFCSSLI